jgi:hypothetical protein
MQWSNLRGIQNTRILLDKKEKWMTNYNKKKNYQYIPVVFYFPFLGDNNNEVDKNILVKKVSTSDDFRG